MIALDEEGEESATQIIGSIRHRSQLQQLLACLRCHLRPRSCRLDPDPLVVARLWYAQPGVAFAFPCTRWFPLDVTVVYRVLLVNHDPCLVMPAIRLGRRMKRLRPLVLRGVLNSSVQTAF